MLMILYHNGSLTTLLGYQKLIWRLTAQSIMPISMNMFTKLGCKGHNIPAEVICYAKTDKESQIFQCLKPHFCAKGKTRARK